MDGSRPGPEFRATSKRTRPKPATGRVCGVAMSFAARTSGFACAIPAGKGLMTARHSLADCLGVNGGKPFVDGPQSASPASAPSRRSRTPGPSAGISAVSLYRSSFWLLCLPQRFARHDPDVCIDVASGLCDQILNELKVICYVLFGDACIVLPTVRNSSA